MYQVAAYQKQYKQQDVMSASPLRLVIMAYDLAIKSCEREDFSKAVQTVSALRDALDLDYPEVATGLFSLYQWCLDSIRAGDYSSAIHTLGELREAWVATEKQLAPAKQNISAVKNNYTASMGNILT
jgi:flagellin-specific chaperone FliS